MTQLSLENHEERIVNLETDNVQVKAHIIQIDEDLKEKYTRIEESNKYLREHTTALSNQNERILSAVLSGNQEAQQRSDERKMMEQENKGKFWLTVVGSGGVIALVIELVIRLIGG